MRKALSIVYRGRLLIIFGLIFIVTGVFIWTEFDISKDLYKYIIRKLGQEKAGLWAIGFFFSLGIGHVFESVFLKVIRPKKIQNDNYIDCWLSLQWAQAMHLRDKRKKSHNTFLCKTCDMINNGKFYLRYLAEKRVQLPGWAVGFIERFFFTLFVALGVDVTIGIIGWVGIKMATGWSRAGKSEPNNEDFRIWKAGAFTSLFGNLISMSFAVLGGMICRIKPWHIKYL